GTANVIVATRLGVAIRFHETDVRPMGRLARGVKALTLKEGDEVVGMSVVRQNGLVLTVSETGYGRLSNPEDYRIQTRGGKGLLNYHIEKYGKVAAIKVVDLNDDVIIISQEGIIIRIAAASIRVCSRPSKGVTVMKVGEGDRVVTLARSPHEEEAENLPDTEPEEPEEETDGDIPQEE
ncbi:MAG: DNA gyrase subunit A, partial [Ruminococcus sp.]|nr:DNA gyrase subunit A [Ruminococcus sp.]